MEIHEAVDKAIDEMPKDCAIQSFLKQHQSEVRNMCITEYNEAETMQMFREEGIEEGKKVGRAEGREECREEGRYAQLISQICRKLRKGKSVDQIAEELEEDEVRVQAICDAAEEFAPDYDEEKVAAAVGISALV